MMSSIRGRVVVLALAAQLVAAAGAVGLAIWFLHRALWSSADSELQARAIALLALVGQADNNPYAVDFDADQANIPREDLFYIQDPHGNALAGSASWITNDREQRPGRPWKFAHNGIQYRGKALLQAPILDQENRQVPQLKVDLYYAMPVTRTEAQIESGSRAAVLAGILCLCISAGLTWLAVGRGMRPLTDLARQADMIQAERAEFMPPQNLPPSAELVPLIHALQSLALRVQAAFQRERQFLSDAAHELKTAVAIQKSTLQLLEQGKTTEEEYREGITRAVEDTARIERLVADMLLLSSIEHSRSSPDASDSARPLTSLNESVAVAIDRLGPMARVKSVSIDSASDGNHQVEGVEAELTLLWTNLLENAIQHSPRGSQVRVEVKSEGARRTRIRVVDHGSGIPSTDLAHVFERFYRSDISRSRSTGGFGLGLSIAKAIVDNLHGSIHLDSVENSGTTVEVILPVATDGAVQCGESGASSLTVQSRV